MGKGPCTFKEADVSRALKAAKKAGFEIVGFSIDPSGKITVQIGKPPDSEKAPNEDEWAHIQ
jgi:hypothetical protein